MAREPTTRRSRGGWLRAKPDVVRYHAALLDHLFATHAALAQSRWQPGRSSVFITTRPKLREIHAAPFCDRVVHHALVAQWTPLCEPGWIHASFANRLGKGTHAAVDCLERMLRQASAAGPNAHYLQLDIASFFHSIDHARLRQQLACCLRRALKRHQITRADAIALWRPTLAVIADQPGGHARALGSRARFAAVPMHKRLGALGPGRGLPIGNLTSQFFGNVVLDALDQFVKHRLKARWYVRYVDDFVLLAPDAATLADWRERIAEFLQRNLGLRLKHVAEPRPIAAGIDFLGYVLRPAYRLVRRRVVRRCWSMLAAFERTHGLQAHAATNWKIASPLLSQLHARLASYLGHFRHAHSAGLWQRLVARFAWLNALFIAPEAALATSGGLGPDCGLRPRWQLPNPRAGRRLNQQLAVFRSRLPVQELLYACGTRWRIDRAAAPARAVVELDGPAARRQCRAWRAAGTRFAVLTEHPLQRDGRRERRVAAVCHGPSPHSRIRQEPPP